MLLLLEGVILCAVFTSIILPAQYKNPLSQIMSYPPEIRKRVESLPQYQDTLSKTKQKNIITKLIGALFISVAFAVIAYFSGAKNFCSTFTHVFLLFLILNTYDVIILDICLFCHSQKLRIPGTEDMEREYRDPRHHIKGGIKGLLIGILVALLSASFVSLSNLLF